MIANYARAAFAAGYAEIAEAFPVPLEVVTLAMQAAVAAAEAADNPAVLGAVRESGRREALTVVIRRRRVQLEDHWSAQFRPLVEDVGRRIAPVIAQRFRPRKRSPRIRWMPSRLPCTTRSTMANG